MAYKVRWSKESSDDLENIAEFISRDSDNYARIVVNNVIDSVVRLSKFPYSGRVVPEYGDELVREIFIYNYRVIYKISDNLVIIIAIIHGKRLLKIDNRI